MKRFRLSIAIATLAFAAAAYVLGWSTLLTVSSIEITGTANKVSSGIELGQRLARVQPRSISADFEEIPWIESAKVSRNWINGKVTVSIIERTPIAIFNEQAIDHEGKSFPLYNQPIQELPRIEALNIDAAISAVYFYNSLPNKFAKSIVKLKVYASDSYTLDMNRGKKTIELAWGQNKDNALKIRVYEALITRPENLNIQRIDLSAPHAPIVK